MHTALLLKGIDEPLVINTIAQFLSESLKVKGNTNYVLKPGMKNVEPIITFIAQNNKTGANELLQQYTLNELMGAIYGAVTHNGVFHVIFEQCKRPEFINKHTRLISDELDKIIETLQIVFGLPKTFTDVDFYKLANKVDVCQKTNNTCFRMQKGGWLNILLDMMVYRDRKRFSIVNRNLNNLEYVRKRRDKSEVEDYKHVTKLQANSCPKFTKTTNTKENVFLVDGDTWYDPDDNSFYKSLLANQNRVVKAGPSGSTFMWMNFVFNLLRVEATKENKHKLLFCIICDFVPHFHSLNEVLFVYSREDEYSNVYTIDQNPAEWLLNLLGVKLGDLSRVEDITHFMADYCGEH